VFLSDSLEADPDSEEAAALEDELYTIGERIRPVLAELLILNHLLVAQHQGPDALRSACKWHYTHLGPMLSTQRHRRCATVARLPA